MTCLASFVREHLAPLHHGERALPPPSYSLFSPGARDEDLEASVRGSLTFIPADCGYADWFRIGCALKSIDARQLWLDWSYSSPKAVRGEPEAKWEKLAADRTGYAAIFAEAQRRGWRNPGSHYATNIPFHASAMALADKIRADFAAGMSS